MVHETHSEKKIQKHETKDVYKRQEVFSVLHDLPDNHDFFITVCADIDLIYKITNSLDYEASRYAVIQEIEAHVFEHFSYWKFEGEDGNYVFIIKTQQKNAVRQIKTCLLYTSRCV